MITIKQSPTDVKTLGQKIKKFPSTVSIVEIPLKDNGKWDHGLRGKEVELVENHYNVKFDDSTKAREFYGNMTFELKHSGEPIGDITSPPELLKLRVIQAVTGAADSLEQVREKENFSPFVVVDTEQEVKDQATLYQIRDEAIYRLMTLKKSKKHLIAVASYLYPTNHVFRDESAAYVKLREYINGDVIKNKKQALTKFTQAVELEKDRLYATVTFRTALLKNIIRKNANQRYFNTVSTTEYGKTEEECVNFLLNPKNQEEIGTGGATDQPYSLMQQLKTK